LSFEPNAGQTDGTVRFLSRGPGYTLFLTGDQAVLHLRRTSSVHSPQALDALASWQHGGIRKGRSWLNQPQKQANAVLSMQLVGANPKVTTGGADELPGKANYLIGSDPRKWRTHVPTYARVKYSNVYPGIDLVYYGNQSGQLEYDFVVAPGADPSAIVLGVAPGVQAEGQQSKFGKRRSPGKTALRIASDGDLIVRLREGEVRLHKPVAYQLGKIALANLQKLNAKSGLGVALGGSRTVVESHYILTATNQVRFVLGPYDHTKTLCIDPILYYSTYMGGAVSDTGYGIALDSNGDAYIAGATSSPNFPNATDSLNGTAQDAFITELNPTGTAVLYYTYLGGSGADAAYGIAVDSLGNAYVTGLTYSADFPTVNPLSGTVYNNPPATYTGPTGPNTYAATYGTGFVAELPPGGASLVFSTYLGGSEGSGGVAAVTAVAGDIARAIAVDPSCTSSSCVDVAGTTLSADFPVTSTSYASENYPLAGAQAAFVTKLSWNGSKLTTPFSTLLGGISSGDVDAGNSIAVDSSGHIYVTGQTHSADFPTVNSLPSVDYGSTASGGYVQNWGNAFVAELAPGTASLLFSTLLGGNTGFGDLGTGIAVDAHGNISIAGVTYSEDFPHPNALPGTTPSGTRNTYADTRPCDTCSPYGTGFVAEINPVATPAALVYSSFLGGSSGSGDSAQAIAVDAIGNAYVVGTTRSANFPIVQNLTYSNGSFFNNSALPGNSSTFATEISANGAGLLVSTYLGGSGSDAGFAVAIDSSGDMFLTGSTSSPNFPTAAPYLPPPTSQQDLPYQGALLTSGTQPNAFVAMLQASAFADLTVTAAGAATCTLNNLGTSTCTFTAKSVGQPSPDSPQVITVTNTGNAPATFNSITIIPSIAGSTDFTLFPASTCPTDGTLFAPGASCTVSITFQPAAPVKNETATLLIDYKNVGVGNAGGFDPVQVVNLVGSVGPQGIVSTPTTTTVTSSANRSIYGSSVTFTATVSSSSGTPTGTVTFTAGSTTLASNVPLSSGAATTSTSSLAPGSYTVTAAYTPTTGSSYKPSSGSLTQTVNPAALTITASSGSFTYGGTPPAITASYNGFVNGETSSSLTTQPTCSTTATSTSPLGSYPSSCSGAVDPNYTFSYVGGTVNVIPAALTITAKSTSKNYGLTLTFAGTEFTTSGLLNTDSVTSVTLTSGGAAAGATVASSPYSIVPSAAVGTGLGNYTITYVNGSLTVMAAPLTITASSGSMTYGGTPPSITPSYSGFVNGDTAASLTTQPTCTTTATSSSAVGTYSSTCSGASASNYTISYASGSVIVNAALPTVAAVGGTFPYNGNPEPASATAVGIDGTTPVSGAFYITYTGTGSTAYSTSTTPPTNVGTYSVGVLFTSANSNYTNGTTSTTIVISPATALVVVTSSANPSTFGAPVSFTATVSSAAGTPTGTVNFAVDGATLASAVALSGANATSPATSSLSPGEHVVTAVYSGDTNFLPSTSAFLIQVVNNPLVSIAVTPSNPSISVGGTQQFTATGKFADNTSAILPTGGTWAVGNSMTNGVGAPMAAGSNGLLYYLGGQDAGGAENYVQSYNPATGAWNTVTSTPAMTARYQGVAVSPGNGLIYVIGGWNGSAPTNVVEAYDPVQNAWTTEASLGHPSGCSVGGAINGLIYVLTGCDGNPGFSKEFDVYNPATDSWTSLSSPAHAHNAGAGGVIAGKLYVTGGYDVSGATGITEVYDPQSSTWTTVSSMPAQLGELGGAAFSGNLYVVGGLDNSGNPQASIYVYAPQTDTWSTLPSSLSAGRNNIGVVALDGLLCAAGGYTSSPSNTLEVLDTDDVTWSSATPAVATVDPSAGLATGVSAGTANITATSATYSVSGSTPLTVNKQNQTITFSALANQTYGNAPFSVSATATSGLPVSFASTTASVCTTSGTYGSTVTMLAVGPCSITASQAGNSSYNAAPNVSQGFSVNPAGLTITASSGTMTYGGTVPTITPSYGAFVNGDNATVVTGIACSTTATPSSPVGSYASTCSGASAPNYTITTVNGSVSVTAAPLTVTASSGTMTYGGTVPTITPTYSGFVNGQGASIVSGTTCSTTATPSSPVGSYPSTCSGASAPNYTITTVNGSVSVTAAPLTVTASSGTMTYGGTVPTITPTYSGFVNGQGASIVSGTTCSTTATPSSPVGSYPSTCSGASAPNYTITTVNGSVSVTAAPLTVTASSGTMTYGGTVPTITPSYSGFVNGQGASVVTGTTCSTTATATSPVGSYPSTCTGATAPNYTISTVNGSVSVTAAPLTVTASSGTMSYGGTVPTITPSYSGFVNGQGASVVTGTTCSTTATATSPVGSYPSTCTGATAPNYTISTVNGSVSVTAAALTVTASSGTMTYGGTVPTITPTYSGFVNGQGPSVVTGTTCSTTATPTSAVGSYPSSCTGATAPNYTITTVNGTVSVTAAALTVTASSGTMTYGGTVPTITPSYSGFVNGQGPSVVSGTTCSTTATSSSPVGSYPSSCTGAIAPNYTITPVNGTVSVTAAALTVTASSGTMTYGGTVPTITPTYSGFVNGQGPSVVTGTTCSTTATPSSPVGSYSSTCTGAIAPNYTITPVNGTVSVTAAALTVTASSGTMTYGGTVPTITPSYSGFVNGQGPSVVTGTTCSTTATPTSAVGSYPSSCTGATAANYTITTVNGTVSVTAAALTVTASSGTMTYGGTVPTITPSYSGFVNGQGPSVVTGTTCSTTATASSPVGSYPSSCTGATAANYAITTVNGTVSVTAAALTVTASSGTMTYGGTVPTITPTYSGFVNGQGPSVVSGTTCSTTATSSSPVGSYPSSCSGATAPNYTITAVNGTVSVTAAALTVTASSGTMTYGGTVPTITPSYSGFVNGQTASVVTGTTCSTTATPTSPVGSYPSSCTGATAPNYTITTVNGTVSVTAAPLTVTASSGTMTYGGTPPAITASYSGFVNGDTAATLTTAPTCSTTATSHSSVGSYPSSCSGAVNSNYTISYVAGTVTVSPVALVITASSGTMTYGGTPPTITASYSGFVSGDTSASLSTAPTCSTTATSHSSVGSYPSSCSGAVDSNYTISYVAGTVTVSPAALVMTASSGTMTYGGAPPTITASYSGFVNGDTSASLTTQPTCSTTATSSSTVGSYPSSCAGAADSNYTISYVSGTVTVSPAPLTITANNASMTQGSATPTLTATYSGFVNGNGPSNLTGTLVCTTTATSSSPAGTYPITCSGQSSTNYSITYVPGTLTITAAVSQGVPIASVAPGCISFGDVLVGTNCPTQPATLTNIGTASLTVYGITIIGPQAADFSQTNNCGTSLAAGASCTINVGFKPSTVGPETATLSLNDNSNNVNSTQTVGLIGAGVSQIQANFNGTSIPSGNYVWFNSVFSPKNIPSSGSVTYSLCNVQVTFTAGGSNYTVPLPNAIITLSSSVSVATTTFNTANNRWITLAPLTGLAGNIFLDGGAFPVPSSGLPGGIQNVNWQASFATDTLGAGLNWQWAAAVYNNFTTNYNQLCVKPVDDTTHSQYQNSDHAGTCEGTNSQNVCWKQCVCAGATGGGGSNCTGSCSGTGSCSPPVCPVTTVTCATLGTTAVGTTTTPVPITLTNNSSTTVTGITISISGPYAVSSTTCGTSLAPGATCTIYVTFTPTAAGTQTGTLTITDSASNSPQTVNLSGNLTGTVVTIPGPVANVSPGCIAFSGFIQADCQQWGVQPATPQTVTLSNTGSGVLNIASVQITGTQASDFSFVNNCPTNLAAGAQCTISVSFSPQTVGPAQASLVITDNSNDVTGSTQTVSLNGAGLTQLQSNFNENLIAGVSDVWFSASMSPQNINPSTTTNFFMTNGTLTFTENNQNFSLSVPDSIVTFSPNVTTASTSFDTVNNRWVTVAPTSGYSGNTFLGAVAYQVPNEGLPGSISNVVWTAAFSTDTPGASFTWQWAAAPYSSLPSTTDVNNNQVCDYNSCNVKPVDGPRCNNWNDNENAGTPEGYQSYVYAGATCDGVSNHTGNYCNPGAPTCKLGPVYVPTCSTAPPTTVGQTCPPVPITICNKGSQPLIIANVQCTGDFKVVNNVSGTTLQPGQSCAVNVSFCPTQKGTRCGTLQVTDNSTSSPHTVSLTGTGQ
jgi:hypothetical protein